MAENRSLSSSEQYVKKSSRRLLFLGLGLGILFIIALALIPGGEKKVTPQKSYDYNVESEFEKASGVSKASLLPYGSDARFAPNPAQVNMTNVVLGSKAEALIVLTAEKAPILFLGMELAETQQDGFTLESTCVPNTQIAQGSSCNVKVLWNPVELRQISNILYVRWRVDDAATYQEERTSIQLTAQSTDSKDCVICENIANAAEKKARKAMSFSGQLIDLEEDGTFTLDGKKFKLADNDLILDENGNIWGVAEPERIALDMKHKIIGTISSTQDVVDANGETLGRVLGDGTIVTPDLKVIGAALPVVSVMDLQGNVIGKMTKDGSVVDAQNAVIGRPLVDGTIVDLSGKEMGTLRPWGLVVDFNSKVIGAVLPDGNVRGNSGQNIAKISPTALAIDPAGELIGGIVPQGVAVGSGCTSIGEVLQNGQIKDSFEQIVGYALLDGTVIDLDGNDLGGVISQGLIINEKGNILGFVNSEGKAVDAKGKLIGCVGVDGSVTAGKKPLGAIMAKGRVIGNGCRVLGSVYPNGSVVTLNGDTIGKVLSDKYVTDAANRIVGVVVPRGTAIAEGCRLLGLISLSGRVVDTAGTDIGCVTPTGEVINSQKTVIGSVNARGIVVDDNGNFVGRVRIDGKVVDKSGKVIGCINPDGTATDLNGKPLGRLVSYDQIGAVLDANGNPTGWTVVGQDVYNEQNIKVGTLAENGAVIDEKGRIIAFIPPDGVIFSPEGLVLGRYSRETGVAVNMNGDKFAKILPDMTAISGDKNEIIGALIADKTAFMSMDGTLIGSMQIDGALNGVDGSVVGAIRADGSVVDKTGRVIGVKIPQGPVLSATGEIIGTVSNKGLVLSAAKTAIGRVLGNGLAISNSGTILGGVLSDIQLAIGADGFIGTISPKGVVVDKNGRKVGKTSPFGLVLGASGELLGKVMRVGPFVDGAGNTIGWLGFDGELNTKDNQTLQVLSNTTAIDADGRIIGALTPRGIAVNSIGSFVGTITPNARVLGANNAIVGSFKASPYFYDVNQALAGYNLKPGVALDTNGNLIGWTRYDGIVENAQQAVGLVSLDGRIFAENGTVIGFYLPLGAVAINDSGKSFGFMGTNGLLINTKGDILGKAVSPTSVIQNAKLVGTFLTDSDFVSDLTSGNIIGQVSPSGSVSNIRDAKPLGNIMMNKLVQNLTKQVVGGLTEIGVPMSDTLTVLGQTLLNGHVFSDGNLLGKTTATKAILDLGNRFIGHMEKPEAFIGRDGNIIGASEGGISVVSAAGTPIANQMPFGTALTGETLWAGAKMPSGVIVTDDGFDIGVIASDGAVIGENNTVMGRVLADKTASGIIDRMTYTTMPYVGAVVRQGIPVHFKGNILGRTTMDGGVLDATDKRTHRLLDDGSIMGTQNALDGFVIPFGMAINHDGAVIGMLSGDGSVVMSDGQIAGQIASNGAVKGVSALLIKGTIVPDGLVTNGCSVLGQTTQNGQIVNGKGTVVGRVLVDRSAVNKSGERIGQITVTGAALSTNGDFMGRSLPDGSVVDIRGSNIGCVGANGEITDTSGTLMGCVLQRGPIISEAGELLGRSKFDGTVVNAAGAVIGKMGGDCQTAVDAEGNTIGRMVKPTEQLMYNPDGSIAGTFDLDGTFYNPEGEAIFKVEGNRIIDPKTGRQIAVIDEKTGQIKTLTGENLTDITVIRDNDGTIIGLISGCNVLNPEGTKIASIMADGSIIDLNGELYATILGDGTVLNKEGTKMGSVDGMNTRLDRCGIKTSADGTSSGAAGRRIFIGKNAYGITSTGSLVTEDGTVVGYMGQDGRPYSLTNKLLTGTGMDSEGRVKPNINKKMTVSPEQLEQMQQLLAQKREGMRGGIRNVIKPEGRILAKARKKEDKDWGLPRIVSSWPVKMTNMILRDKAIPAVLVRSIDSRYKDVPATAIVERHIYSEEGRNIIIPAGSRLIGKISGSPGENHVAKMELKWERLIRPDGGAFSFSAGSGDAQGRGGVAAYLDEQLLAKYGKPLLSSSVTSAIAYLAASNDKVSTTENGTTTQSDRSKAAEDARETFTDNMDQIFQQLIDESTSIPPVVFVPAGTRLTVFSNEDLWLRSEEEDVRDYDEQYGAPSTAAKNVGTSSWIDKRGTPADQIAAGATQGNAASDVYYNPDDAYGRGTSLDQADYEKQLMGEGLLYDGEGVIDQQDYMDTTPTQQQVTQGSSNGQTTAPDLTNRVSKPILPKTQQTSKMF